jgi:hypothetical protein
MYLTQLNELLELDFRNSIVIEKSHFTNKLYYRLSYRARNKIYIWQTPWKDYNNPVIVENLFLNVTMVIGYFSYTQSEKKFYAAAFHEDNIKPSTFTLICL